jgi:hypothetical protein
VLDIKYNEKEYIEIYSFFFKEEYESYKERVLKKIEENAKIKW